MRKIFPVSATSLLIFTIALSAPSLAQEWQVRKLRGTLKVVELGIPSTSINLNYAEGLITRDRDNNFVPCLAKDWRWIDDRTIEFKLRKDVTFHNGEEFNAEALRINWEHYTKLRSTRPLRIQVLPEGTVFEIIDDDSVRFILPEPNNLAYVQFEWFFQIAPAFFKEHEFPENNWAFFPEPGPWGTGPFQLVEGNLAFGKPSEQIVLDAYEEYWDPQYPKVRRVIFNNKLIGDREEAMRLCRETKGNVDIVSHIRPLDTLKVAESPFAKVVKSKNVALLRGYLNQRKTESKWRDIRLRKAVNYAINREELWKYAAKGNAYNLEGFFVPAGAYGHNPNLTPYTYNTTKARELLTEAGYPKGFEAKMITYEGRKLVGQIISKMLERIGLKVRLEVLTIPEWLRKTYIPFMDRPPQEQDWDIALSTVTDWFGHTGASFLTDGLLEDSHFRWIESDPVYETMWKEMVRAVDKELQEEKIRQMVQYIYDRAHLLFIYSPLALYAANKEVNFVPQRFLWLRLKDTSVNDNHWSVREKNQ
jgi:peptide/nickel transport system substrate-binding protein